MGSDADVDALLDGWAGDGTDLMEPVRAHMLAALRPSAGPYAPPLDQLLLLVEVDRQALARSRTQHAIGQGHASKLMAMRR